MFLVLDFSVGTLGFSCFLPLFFPSHSCPVIRWNQTYQTQSVYCKATFPNLDSSCLCEWQKPIWHLYSLVFRVLLKENLNRLLHLLEQLIALQRFIILDMLNCAFHFVKHSLASGPSAFFLPPIDLKSSLTWVKSHVCWHHVNPSIFQIHLLYLLKRMALYVGKSSTFGVMSWNVWKEF